MLEAHDGEELGRGLSRSACSLIKCLLKWIENAGVVYPYILHGFREFSLFLFNFGKHFV